MKVWIVAISHRHGTNYEAAATHEAALSIAAAFARQWWHEWPGLHDEDIPADDEAAMERYFEIADDEFCEITETEVVGA